MGQSIFDRKKKLVPNTLRRIAAGFEKFGLTPHVYSMEHGGRSRDIQQPMITLTATPAHALVSPWIVELRGTGGAQLDSTAFDIREPLGTVTAGGVHHWLAHSTVREIQCQPYLLPQHSGATGRPVAEPASTVATAGAIALISPSLREVGDLIKAGKKPRFMVDGRLWELDVRYRMLDPKELAKIQGFRDGYFFGGKRNDQIRQIGNAVPRNTARALVRAVLSQSSK
jgi:DNA (cytosine-5)-methyltransferase 1